MRYVLEDVQNGQTVVVDAQEVPDGGLPDWPPGSIYRPGDDPVGYVVPVEDQAAPAPLAQRFVLPSAVPWAFARVLGETAGQAAWVAATQAQHVATRYWLDILRMSPNVDVGGEPLQKALTAVVDAGILQAEQAGGILTLLRAVAS